MPIGARPETTLCVFTLETVVYMELVIGEATRLFGLSVPRILDNWIARRMMLDHLDSIGEVLFVDFGPQHQFPHTGLSEHPPLFAVPDVPFVGWVLALVPHLVSRDESPR